VVACDEGANVIDLPEAKGSLWSIRVDFHILCRPVVLIELTGYTAI
jgi:hypothetical protein